MISSDTFSSWSTKALRTDFSIDVMSGQWRLLATLNGEPVDRPAVSIYEIGGFIVNPDDPGEYNIYYSPSWQPLLKVYENHTDIVRLVYAVRAQSHLSWAARTNAEIRKQFVQDKAWEINDCE